MQLSRPRGGRPCDTAGMGHFSEQAIVKTTPGAAFEYITDQSRLAEWNDHVESAEVVGGGQVEVGSELQQHRRRNNRAFTLNFTVTDHQLPTRHVVTGAVFGIDTTMAFRLDEVSDGTRVTMTADVAGRGLGRLMAPMVTREMRKSTVSALAALQAKLSHA